MLSPSTVTVTATGFLPACSVHRTGTSGRGTRGRRSRGSARTTPRVLPGRRRREGRGAAPEDVQGGRVRGVPAARRLLRPAARPHRGRRQRRPPLAVSTLAARAARVPRSASWDARRLAALHVLDTMGCAVSGATHPSPSRRPGTTAARCATAPALVRPGAPGRVRRAAPRGGRRACGGGHPRGAPGRRT